MPPRRPSAPPLLAASLLAAAAALPRAAAAAQGGWPQAGFGPTKSSFSALALGPASVPNLLWRANVTGPFGSAMALTASGTLLLGTYAGNASALLALSAATGATQWSFPVAGNAGAAPAIAADGSIYFASDARALYKLTAGGTLAWSFTSTAPSSLISIAIGPDGAIYYGTLNGLLYKFAAGGASSVPVWSVPLPNLAGAPSLSPHQAGRLDRLQVRRQHGRAALDVRALDLGPGRLRHGGRGRRQLLRVLQLGLAPPQRLGSHGRADL